jgi:hypothetical protein
MKRLGHAASLASVLTSFATPGTRLKVRQTSETGS